MKKLEVMEKISPLMGLNFREVQHEAHTRVQVGVEEVVFRPGNGGHSLPLSPEGQVGLAHFAGFNENYFKNLSNQTLGQVATELLLSKEKYGILVKDGHIVDFTAPKRYHNVPPEKVLNVIEHAIPDVEYSRALVDRESIHLEVVGQDELPVLKGDNVRAGALIKWSPIGTMKPIVQSFVVRRVCTNGVTSNTVLREFGFGGGDEGNVWEWFKSSVRSAYRSYNQVGDAWRRLVNENVPDADRPMMLEALIKQAGIPPEAAEIVRGRALQEPPTNAYQMLNLVSWATSHLMNEPKRVYRSQSAIAQYVDAETHARICPVCHKNR